MQTTTHSTVTGVILAGGMGRRLQGQDKGLVEVGGKPMIEHVISRFEPQTDALLVNANRNLDIYRAYGHSVISDELSDFQGPLAGFATAMAAADTDYILTAPCDGPLLPADLRQRLQDALIESQQPIAVVHANERLQPVYALMRVDLLPSLHAFLESGQRKIDIWFAEAGMTAVDFSDCPDAFLNVNTEEDAARIEAVLVESS